jgi:hypothetical protein
MIYFLRAASGPVKIGHAANLTIRLRDLRASNHETLDLIRTLPGAVLEERWLHRRYVANRIHHEWFRFDPSMLEIEIPAELVLERERTEDGTVAHLATSIAQMAKRRGVAMAAIHRALAIDPSGWNRLSGTRSPTEQIYDRLCAVAASLATRDGIAA